MVVADMDCVRGSNFIAEGIRMCPFLRSIVEPTSFSFGGAQGVDKKSSQVVKGPLFEDGPSFDTAFRLFHGKDGVVPLKCAYSSPPPKQSISRPSQVPSPAAAAATISISTFGTGAIGPFSYDSFREAREKKAEKKRRDEEEARKRQHEEVAGSDWLQTGNCPLAKSYRAVGKVLPLVAGLLKPSPGMKYTCPPAIVAARAALAKTPALKALRPQALPYKVLAIGTLGMFLNMPLGAWREHCKKFSWQWIVAVHASVPFVAMLRKAALMPKYAMAFTIAAAIIGQGIGARMERKRLGLPPKRKSVKSKRFGRQIRGLLANGSRAPENHVNTILSH